MLTGCASPASSVRTRSDQVHRRFQVKLFSVASAMASAREK